MIHTFNWKRRKDDYTVTSEDGEFLFNLNILLDPGPPPKRMKHQDTLKAIEIRLNSMFPPPKPVDQSGTITI